MTRSYYISPNRQHRFEVKTQQAFNAFIIIRYIQDGKPASSNQLPFD